MGDRIGRRKVFTVRLHSGAPAFVDFAVNTAK
jgi:hypothetical protein